MFKKTIFYVLETIWPFLGFGLIKPLYYCQALCPFWSLIFEQNRQRLKLKSIFTHHPPENFFVCQIKGMAKTKTFILHCYGIDFALICFIRRQRFSHFDLCYSLLIFLSFCWFFFSVWPSVFLSVLLPVCISFCLSFLLTVSVLTNTIINFAIILSTS